MVLLRDRSLVCLAHHSSRRSDSRLVNTRRYETRLTGSVEIPCDHAPYHVVALLF